MAVIQRRTIPSDVWMQEDEHPVLQRVYAARGVLSAAEIEKELTALLPYQDLKGIHDASELLTQAVMQQQRIMVIGDFDADGATSTALAVSCLRLMGAQHVHYLVPNRFEYGYGLTPEIVEVAAAWQPELIITVDNGISSIAGVLAAHAIGAKVLITDHHLPANELPAADAIVNPNQPGCSFASKNLAGVGVIFYVMLALRQALRVKEWFVEPHRAEPNLGQVLDLVALGTVADVVPLDKNNRILVHQGLRRIRSGRGRPGIQALLTVANRNVAQVAAQDLGFSVAPRLNAAGRLDDMSLGIVCLLSESLPEALGLASQLDLLNQERRQIEAEMSQQAFQALEKLSFGSQVPAGICLFNESWHQGVIGIVASRVKEKHYRPVIAFARAGEGQLKGSARSIAGIHIRDCLDHIAVLHPTLINKFGGHAMAAGLTLEEKNFPAFQKAFEEEVSRHFDPQLTGQIIYSDGALQENEFSLTLAERLKYAEPWGQAFPEPVFDGVFQLVDQRLVGSKHLKMVLSLPQSSQMLDAIAFNVDIQTWPNHRAQQIHGAYRLDINEFRGRRTVQLVMEHITAITA